MGAGGARFEYGLVVEYCEISDCMYMYVLKSAQDG